MVNHDSDSEFSVVSTSPDETRALARRLGELCRGGEVILLRGDLGAGKTCFTQGLALGLDVDPLMRITSPTFTLHGEYPGRLILNHVDLYRLDDPCQADTLGIADLFDDPEAVLAIEWPELLGDAAAGDNLTVRLEHRGEGEREIAARAEGKRHRELLRCWLAGDGVLS